MADQQLLLSERLSIFFSSGSEDLPIKKGGQMIHWESNEKSYKDFFKIYLEEMEKPDYSYFVGRSEKDLNIMMKIKSSNPELIREVWNCQIV